MDTYIRTYGIVLARVLLAALFLMAGIGKIATFSSTVGFVGSTGLPAPELLTVLAIVIEIGGAAALVVGWQTTYASLALILFTLIASFVFHGPGTWSDQMQQTTFLKNLAIIGGLLYVIAHGAGGTWTLGGRKAQNTDDFRQSM